eukprot:g11781.t1
MPRPAEALVQYCIGCRGTLQPRATAARHLVAPVVKRERPRAREDGKVNAVQANLFQRLSPSMIPHMQGKVWSGGVLTKAAVLELIAEQGQFRQASTEMMAGVVDIINLLILEGGSRKLYLTGRRKSKGATSGGIVEGCRTVENTNSKAIRIQSLQMIRV